MRDSLYSSNLIHHSIPCSHNVCFDTRLEATQAHPSIYSLASRVPAKQRGTSIKPTVQKLASKAYEHGLLPDPLNELIDLLTSPSHLDQASLNALVNNLYPATRLSSDAVLKVVGCLGNGQLKPPFPIQAGLLRWLVMVYHVIDGPGLLSQAYPVLFNLLETAAIRFAELSLSHIGVDGSLSPYRSANCAFQATPMPCLGSHHTSQACLPVQNPIYVSQ